MTDQKTAQRIVIIGPAHPFRGGIADTNEAMARAFIRAGHSTDIVTFTVQYPSVLFPGKTQFSEDPAPKGLAIHRWIHSYNPLNWLRAAKKITALAPDIIIVRFWLPFMGPCFGSILRLVGKKPVIIGLTDNVIPHEKRFMDAAFTSYFMSACDGFTALSRAVLADIKSLTNKPADYFLHPINDQFPEPISKSEARQLLSIDQEGTYLLFFGFIRKYKGLDLLLEALADERLRSANVKLIVAGESYDGMGDYLSIIDRFNMHDRVILHTDFIPMAHVARYFSAADLVTQTYRTATQSGITQMALHFNRPALITRVGGLEEFIIEGKTGFLSSTAPLDIANKVVDFLGADAEHFEASIAIEKQRYSWDAFVQHFNLFYQNHFRP